MSKSLKGIWAGTGHRPEKLGGYAEYVNERLVLCALKAFETNKPKKVISGMALGWDQALASACVADGIPFIAAVPFEGQEKLWPKPVMRKYRSLLALAEKVVIVSPGPYAAYKMAVRNRWMVDHAELVLALYDGSKEGGTYNCIQYAEQKKKTIVNVWGNYELICKEDDEKEESDV